MSRALRSVTQFRNPEKNKSRRTLQELQVSANDYNQLVPSPMAGKNGKEATTVLDSTYKVIPVIDNPLEKENLTARRSKRKIVPLDSGTEPTKEVPPPKTQKQQLVKKSSKGKNIPLDGYSGTEPPKEVPPPKTQKQQLVKKSSKGKKGALKKGETKLPDAGQSTLNAFVSASSSGKPETSVSSELNKLSTASVLEKQEEKSVSSESNGLQFGTSNENDELKKIIPDCAPSPTDTTFIHKSSLGIDLVSSEVSEGYWKEIAEQRRIALDKTLYENAMLYDNLEVLQTENSQLKSLLEECERVIEFIRGSLD